MLLLLFCVVFVAFCDSSSYFSLFFSYILGLTLLNIGHNVVILCRCRSRRRRNRRCCCALYFGFGRFCRTHSLSIYCLLFSCSLYWLPFSITFNIAFFNEICMRASVNLDDNGYLFNSFGFSLYFVNNLC